MEPRDGKIRNDTPGCDERGVKVDLLSGTVAPRHLEMMPVDKRRSAPKQIESLRLELLRSIIGEFPDEPAFSSDDFLDLDLEILRPESKRLGFPHHAETVRRFNQGLARHAASQDA